MQEIWIDPDIVAWPSVGATHFTPIFKGNWYYPYEIIEHIDKRLDDSIPAREDAVVSLKRGIDRRIEQIWDGFALRNLPVPFAFSRKKGRLDILQQIGIIRPMMINKIRSLRNTVEHTTKEPPSVSECRERVDLAWYFFRSTEFLDSASVESIDLENDQGDGNIAIEWSFPNWEIGITGHIPLSLVIAKTEKSVPVFLSEPPIEMDGKLHFSGTVQAPTLGSFLLAVRFISGLGNPLIPDLSSP